jgi:Flagellar hook-length control protein FliK
MSAAGTVMATSAEGAGDMPSLEPPAGSDGADDSAPTFSEVLSLSSPDLPSQRGVSSPPGQPTGPDEPKADQADTAVPPAHEESSRDPVRSPGRRGQRQADHSTARHPDRGGSAGAAAQKPSRSATAANSATPDTTATQAGTPESAGAVPEQSAAAAPPLTPSSVSPSPSPSQSPSIVSAPAAPSSAVVTTTIAGTESGPPPLASTAAEDPAVEENRAASADVWRNEVTGPPGGSDLSDNGSGPGGVRSDSAPTGRTPDVGLTGTTGVRISADRAAPLGSSAAHAGSEPVQGNGSTSVGATSASGAAGPGASAIALGSAEEVPEPAEFPGGEEILETPTVDIGDLATSISRPLAGGNGDYSVQVSLHPPELGEVRALLSLQGDVLHVTLTPEHASGFEALSEALPALHEQMAGGGLQVNVTLGQPGDTQGEEGQRPAHSGPSANATSDDATPVAPPAAFASSSDGPGRIHLVL